MFVHSKRQHKGVIYAVKQSVHLLGKYNKAVYILNLISCLHIEGFTICSLFYVVCNAFTVSYSQLFICLLMLSCYFFQILLRRILWLYMSIFLIFFKKKSYFEHLYFWDTKNKFLTLEGYSADNQPVLYHSKSALYDNKCSSSSFNFP